MISMGKYCCIITKGLSKGNPLMATPDSAIFALTNHYRYGL